MIQQSCFWLYSQKYWKQGLKEMGTLMFTTALFTIVEDMETTQVFIDRWVDKQNTVYSYNWSLFSLNKEGNSDTCYNMVKFEDINLSEISQSQKGQMLYDAPYMKNLEQSES